MPGECEIDINPVGESTSFTLTDQDHADHDKGGGDRKRHFQEDNKVSTM